MSCKNALLLGATRICFLFCKGSLQEGLHVTNDSKRNTECHLPLPCSSFSFISRTKADWTNTVSLGPPVSRVIFQDNHFIQSPCLVMMSSPGPAGKA